MSRPADVPVPIDPTMPERAVDLAAQTSPESPAVPTAVLLPREPLRVDADSRPATTATRPRPPSRPRADSLDPVVTVRSPRHATTAVTPWESLPEISEAREVPDVLRPERHRVTTFPSDSDPRTAESLPRRPSATDYQAPAIVDVPLVEPSSPATADASPEPVLVPRQPSVALRRPLGSGRPSQRYSRKTRWNFLSPDACSGRRLLVWRRPLRSRATTWRRNLAARPSPKCSPPRIVVPRRFGPSGARWPNASVRWARMSICLTPAHPRSLKDRRFLPSKRRRVRLCGSIQLDSRKT